jgi:hypothetical protein
LRKSIECLNPNRVEYLIVGALAVSWHEAAELGYLHASLRRLLISNSHVECHTASVTAFTAPTT